MDFKPNLLIPTTPGVFDEPAVEQSQTSVEHSVQEVKTKNGEKWLWAIVSEPTLKDATHISMLCVDAYKKLGRPEVAEDLLNLLKRHFG